ncbi:MAG: symmetrical bis(5'-nucleosyl)-tetraphosphatase [Betaproteobacteria bacterium]|nr:symmetrical bis(5'-nucleosyl)-tetraphosphatase [Betaproteobacteria bacterium]MDH5211127.1 symmetrical bis(5'-nucleosyl)-tetraphosphatase [Betaproteobacteria bacterium]
MAIYAIGDVQGCADELQALLAQVQFRAGRDRLWFVGDLVNRGPKSLDVLRFVRALEGDAVVVLGNHDFHLLCLAQGFAKKRADDTLEEVLAAPDAPQLLEWLRRRPLMHVEAGYAMVHAGLLPQWSIEQAQALAREVEAALRGARHLELLRHLYGAQPRGWHDALAGWDRLRVIVNAMARLRFCNAAGEMDLAAKGRDAPPGYRPWFELRPAGEPPIICGHWSALGLKLTDRLVALDTGCVWGGSLSALRLEDRRLFQVPCRGYRELGDG